MGGDHERMDAPPASRGHLRSHLGSGHPETTQLVETDHSGLLIGEFAGGAEDPLAAHSGNVRIL